MNVGRSATDPMLQTGEGGRPSRYRVETAVCVAELGFTRIG
jgi:hypothetical protein